MPPAPPVAAPPADVGEESPEAVEPPVLADAPPVLAVEPPVDVSAPRPFARELALPRPALPPSPLVLPPSA
jgi:hypothetical protein